MTKKMKSKKGLIIAISAGIVAIVVAAVAIVLILKNNNKTVTAESVIEYCKSRNGYDPIVSNSGSEADAGTIIRTLMCGNDDYTIMAQEYKENIKMDILKKTVENDEILDARDNYLKYYGIETAAGNSYYSYGVAEGKLAIGVMARDEATAKKIMIDLGFPDKDWHK